MKLRFFFVIILILTQFASAARYTTYTKLDGSTTNFDGFTEYMIADFMATWCVPCQLSMPALNEVNDKLDGLVSLVSISLDTLETLADIQKFYDDFNGNWQFGWDSDGKLNDTFVVHYYPTTMLLDGDRNVLKQWIGLTEADEILREVDKYVEIPGRFGRDPVGYLNDNPYWYSVILALVMIAVIFVKYKK